MNENFFSQQRVTRFKFMNYSSNSIRQRETKLVSIDMAARRGGRKSHIDDAKIEIEVEKEDNKK